MYRTVAHFLNLFVVYLFNKMLDKVNIMHYNGLVNKNAATAYKKRKRFLL